MAFPWSRAVLVRNLDLIPGVSILLLFEESRLSNLPCTPVLDNEHKHFEDRLCLTPDFHVIFLPDSVVRRDPALCRGGPTPHPATSLSLRLTLIGEPRIHTTDSRLEEIR